MNFSGSCKTKGSNQSSMLTITGIAKRNTPSAEPTETGFFFLLNSMLSDFFYIRFYIHIYIHFYIHVESEGRVIRFVMSFLLFSFFGKVWELAFTFFDP